MYNFKHFRYKTAAFSLSYYIFTYLYFSSHFTCLDNSLHASKAMQVLCAHQFAARDFAGKWIQGLKCSFVRGNRARSKAVRKVFCDRPFILAYFWPTVYIFYWVIHKFWSCSCRLSRIYERLKITRGSHYAQLQRAWLYKWNQGKWWEGH